MSFRDRAYGFRHGCDENRAVLTDSGVGFMNRRDLMRTGLASGIFTGYSRFHYGADVAGGAWSPTPTELPPISSLQDPPTSLNEAIAKKQVMLKFSEAEYREVISEKFICPSNLDSHRARDFIGP